MTKKLLILSAAVLTSVSVFGQGYVTYSFSTHRIWDQFTTPGVGVNNAGIDFAVYWAPLLTADPLSAVPGASSQYGLGGSGNTANLQVATNGVSSITMANINSVLTTAGFTLGSSGANPIVGTTGASGNSLFGQTQITGTTAGSSYEFIVVGWNASAGASAITGATYSAIGWSNPFTYQTGAAANDPAGQTQLSVGMNQFGVAPTAVPEPASMALVAIGGASLLMLRRRKA